MPYLFLNRFCSYFHSMYLRLRSFEWRITIFRWDWLRQLSCGTCLAVPLLLFNMLQSFENKRSNNVYSFIYTLNVGLKLPSAGDSIGLLSLFDTCEQFTAFFLSMFCNILLCAVVLKILFVFCIMCRKSRLVAIPSYLMQCIRVTRYVSGSFD